MEIAVATATPGRVAPAAPPNSPPLGEAASDEMEEMEVEERASAPEEAMEK